MIPKLELHTLIALGLAEYIERVITNQLDKDRKIKINKFLDEEKDNLKLIMKDDYPMVMKHVSYIFGLDLTDDEEYTKEMNENAFNPSKYLNANFLLAVDGQSNPNS